MAESPDRQSSPLDPPMADPQVNKPPQAAAAVGRREFLAASVAGAGMATMGASSPAAAQQPATGSAPTSGGPRAPFKISLAEWSLHRSIRGGEMTNLDFPKVTRQEFGIEGVEYVSQLFKDSTFDQAYLDDLKTRCDDHGVASLLIMIDREGDLGAPDDGARTTAIENHHRWIDAAATLGCHSVRVNAASSGTYDEQLTLAADGLARLGEYAAGRGLNVIVENHGGLSSCGMWLKGVMRRVAMPNVGTLPDFGNFRIGVPGQPEWYDRYRGVEELMPYAKAVSAKAYEFDENGDELRTDFERMMRLVLAAGYHDWVGIEYEGDDPDELAGIRKTQSLLERLQAELA
ncbi:Xylose isomerase-like TIM barrel [Pseudobythopirellula maris]|uniref:Xylose isomerase-like TIM barrel n=1 Tax=Pseudobythopirellula maris TaxID=2527991 RepID=A0A5C5ZTI2_9BACT|nr:sugar phosphate isomerase/epimerase family protein [Pseudobythopirellula maris]TWT90526.1 Xylose isomerase-like TIM barrel [Pseudobythopirellula maris]